MRSSQRRGGKAHYAALARLSHASRINRNVKVELEPVKIGILAGYRLQACKGENGTLLLRTISPLTLPPGGSTRFHCGFFLRVQKGYRGVVLADAGMPNAGLIVSGVLIEDGYPISPLVTNLDAAKICLGSGTVIACIAFIPSFNLTLTKK